MAKVFTESPSLERIKKKEGTELEDSKRGVIVFSGESRRSLGRTLEKERKKNAGYKKEMGRKEKLKRAIGVTTRARREEDKMKGKKVKSKVERKGELQKRGQGVGEMRADRTRRMEKET